MVQRSLFGHGIGGHDGVRGIGTAAQASGQLVHDFPHPGQHLVHGQPVADEPGGTHGYLNGPGLGAPVAEGLRNLFRGGVAVLKSERSGAGIRSAGIENHGAQTARGEYLL